MQTTQITEAQFIHLAEQSNRDEMIQLNSMTILHSSEGIIIQSASGEYVLITQ